MNKKEKYKSFTPRTIDEAPPHQAKNVVISLTWSYLTDGSLTVDQMT